MPNDAMTKEIPMTNAQLGTWDLELPWSLDIGHSVPGDIPATLVRAPALSPGFLKVPLQRLHPPVALPQRLDPPRRRVRPRHRRDHRDLVHDRHPADLPLVRLRALLRRR